MTGYVEIPVQRVTPIEGPEGLIRYSLVLPPESPDPGRAYAAQTTIDSFWPRECEALPTPVNGEVYIDGRFGDPEDPEEAILVGRKGLGQFGLRHARVIVIKPEN